MCGIVGYTGRDQAVGYLLEGLRTLEYRGYDSAGVEVLGADGALHGVKCAGRVATLAERCETANMVGTTGIAHTRWATHGAPTDRNSHPHRDCTGRIAIVHNGIIENFRELRGYLKRNGHELVSETDSEVIAHLIEDAWAGPSKGNLVAAVRNAVRRLEGSWALAVVCADAPGEIVCARNGSPLVVASTDGGAYAASDVTPLASVTSHVTQLENGQIARLEATGRVTVFDADGQLVEHPTTLDIDWDASAATLGGYSDVTALHLYLNQDLGMETYHCPMPASNLQPDAYTRTWLEKALFGGLTGPVAVPADRPLKPLAPGRAEGRLCGGNLSLLAASMGTPWEVDTRGKILFLEDIGEKPYRIDGMLTQLRNGGKLRDCAGVLLGDWTDCDAPEDSLTLEQIFEELLVPAGKPVLMGLACGHGSVTGSLPLGRKCRMDAGNGTIILLED